MTFAPNAIVTLILGQAQAELEFSSNGTGAAAITLLELKRADQQDINAAGFQDHAAVLQERPSGVILDQHGWHHAVNVTRAGAFWDTFPNADLARSAESSSSENDEPPPPPRRRSKPRAVPELRLVIFDDDGSGELDMG